MTLKYIGLVKDPLGTGLFLMHNFLTIAYTSYLENTCLEQWFMEIFIPTQDVGFSDEFGTK